MLPFVANKLDMIDNSENVLKTFNDYVDESEVRFISLHVKESHPWVGKTLKDIDIPPETIIAMLIRDGEIIIPKGDTELAYRDNIVLTAPGFKDSGEIELREIKASDRDEWCGEKITDIDFPENTIVVLIKRLNEIIIPDGNTVVHCDDILVLNYLS